MLLVNFKTKESRLVTCRACKHFVAATQSCGELVVGRTVKYKNTTKKLCGCIMPIKAHLKIASCPIHKWESEISKTDITKVKKILGEIKNNRITGAQNFQLTELYNKIYVSKNKTSNCKSCVKEMINNLTNLLEDE